MQQPLGFTGELLPPPAAYSASGAALPFRCSRTRCKDAGHRQGHQRRYPGRSGCHQQPLRRYVAQADGKLCGYCKEDLCNTENRRMIVELYLGKQEHHVSRILYWNSCTTAAIGLKIRLKPQLLQPMSEFLIASQEISATFNSIFAICNSTLLLLH